MNWTPHPKQAKFLKLYNVYEVMFGGTKGPGKTEALLVDSIRQTKIKDYRALIVRRTYPRLGEIIDRSHKYFRTIANFNNHDSQIKLPAWTFPSGAKLAFAHCNTEEDKYNFQGKEFHYIGFDQVEEFTESQYLFILAQNRTSNPNIVCRVRATANPGGVGHLWVKKRFIDCILPEEIGYFYRKDDEDFRTTESDPRGASRCFVPATIYDNPTLTEADPNYVKRLEQLPEIEKRALLHGDWEVFKGQFFAEWSKGRHVSKDVFNKECQNFISLDYGFANPSSVNWWQIKPNGGIHCYRELYKEGLTYEQLGEKIKMYSFDEKIEYLVCDPAIWGDRSHHVGNVKGESGAETLQKVLPDIPVRRADNSRITGWNRMRIMFANDLISFDPACVNAIRTIPALIHDVKKVEDINSDGEDHAGDSARYACMSRPEVNMFKHRIPEPDTIGGFEKELQDYLEAKQNIEDELNGY